VKRLITIILLLCAAPGWAIVPALVGIAHPTAVGGSAPVTPSNLMVNGITAVGVTIVWNNVTAGSAVLVQANDNRTPNWVDMPVAAFDSGVNPTAPDTTSYFGAYGPGCDGAGSCIDGTQYDCSYLQFRVKAINDFGASTNSLPIQVPPSITVGNLLASLDGSNVGLEYSGTIEYFDFIYVERWEEPMGGGGSYAVIATIAPPDTFAFTDTGVRMIYPTETLHYRIRYHNPPASGGGGGYGPYSNEASTP
jgi:hypothetical protein